MHRVSALRQHQFFRAVEAGEHVGHELVAGNVFGDLHYIGEHGRTGGISAGAASVEHLGAYFFPYQEDGVVGAIDFGQHGVAIHQPGAYGDVDALRVALRRGHQANRRVQALGIVEVCGADLPDTGYPDVRRGERAVEGQPGENRDLVAGIQAVNVQGGIGLGVACGLGLAEGFGKLQAVAFHLRQDEIGRSVHDAVNGLDTVCRQRLRYGADDRSAAAHAGFNPNRQLLPVGQGKQLLANPGDQGLVGGDHCFPVLNARTDDFEGHIRTAPRFDHDVDVLGIHDLVPVWDYGNAIHAGLGAAGAFSAKPGHADGDAIRAPPNLFGVVRQNLGCGSSHSSVTDYAYSYLSDWMKRSGRFDQ